jgi:hypothetical protein
MPCHMQVDYDSRDWEAQAESAPACRGRLIHMTNRCKRMPGLPTAERDDSFFANPQDFIDHHSRGKGPQIMIIGQNVMEVRS